MENKIFIKSDNSIIDKYNKEIEALIEEIKTTPNTEFDIKGTKYFVSSSEGDDNNDGLSEKTPFKTIEKVLETGLKPGDGAFFKRGDTFRHERFFDVKSGVTISAYGEGNKPIINFSRDASSVSDWEKTEFENIYKYTGKLDGFEKNVGAIIFDGGRAWGVHVSAISDKVDNNDKQYAGQRVDNGYTFNGIESYTIPPHTRFRGPEDLFGNLEFYHKIDYEDNSVDELYLRCNEGNPAEVFGSVELSRRNCCIHLVGEDEMTFPYLEKVYKGTKDVIIDNIEVYAGYFGIGMGHVRNITIQHCVFRWIGGQIQGMPPWFQRNFPVRYGNAVESFGHSDGFTMYHNYASQVYDCCWTVQCTGAATMNNVRIERNVAEYANTGSEVWVADGGHLTNLIVRGNYDRYIGYGFSHQRPSLSSPSDKLAGGWRGAGGFFYGAHNRGMICEGNDISNNVYMLAGGSAHSLAAVHPDKYNLHDNVYIMEEGKRMCGIPNHEFRGDYTEEVILGGIEKTGAEKGTKFYCVKENPLGDMYKLLIS